MRWKACNNASNFLKTSSSYFRHAFKTSNRFRERQIEAEYNELLNYISELEAILADEEVLLQLVRDELTEIRDRFGDDRRTEIQLGGFEDLEDEDLIPEEQIVITFEP